MVVLPLENTGTIILIPTLTAFDISEDQFHACPESDYLIKSQVLQSCFIDLWCFLWLCWELWGLGSGCWLLADKHLVAGRRFGNWCWSCSVWTHVKDSCWEHPSPEQPWWSTNKQWNGMWVSEARCGFVFCKRWLKAFLLVFKLKGMCLNLRSLWQ